MTIQFPNEFKYYWKDPSVIHAWVTEPKPQTSWDCPNCGGLGVFVTFCASGGPFENVPIGKDIIAHYANDKWWAGKNYTANCPVCAGSGRNVTYKPSSVRHGSIQWKQTLEAMQTGAIEPIEDDTYVTELEAA